MSELNFGLVTVKFIFFVFLVVSLKGASTTFDIASSFSKDVIVQVEYTTCPPGCTVSSAD